MIHKAETVSSVDVADQPKELYTAAKGLHRPAI